MQVIGDDLLVTNAKRVGEAAASGACNAVLVKVNQAGTLTQARAALDAAKAAGFGTIVSARSGESEDTSIAHLAVGWNAGQLKVGAFARSERLAKWNELLRIEDTMGATRGSPAWLRYHLGNRDVPYFKLLPKKVPDVVMGYFPISGGSRPAPRIRPRPRAS